MEGASSPNKDVKATRSVMTEYWEEHADNLTADAMMLDDDSVLIDESDKAEVLAMVPDVEGKAVCEVGAGIGRFTLPLITQKKVGSLDVSGMPLSSSSSVLRPQSSSLFALN